MRNAIIDVIVPRGTDNIMPDQCRAVIEIENESPRDTPRIPAVGRKDFMEVKALCAALKAVGEPCAIVVETYSRRLAWRVDEAIGVASGRDTRSAYAREIARTAREAGHKLVHSRFAPYGWKYGKTEKGEVVLFKAGSPFNGR